METKVNVSEKSSQIEEISFDIDRQELGVIFKRKGKEPDHKYVYFDVSQEEFDEFRTSESLGKHFGKHIKDVKDWKKIPIEN